MAKKAKAKETKLPKNRQYIILKHDGYGVLEPFTSLGISGACIYDGKDITSIEDAICGAYEEIGGEIEELEEWDGSDIVILSVENELEYIKSTIKKYHSDVETKEKRELARLKKKYEGKS